MAPLSLSAATCLAVTAEVEPPPRGRGLPYGRPPLRRRRAVANAASSSSSVTSRYPVDERFPINPLSRADCESSVASELSVGPPIEWI